MSYKKPSSFIEDTQFTPETYLKDEAVRRHALMSAINEDEEIPILPFKHTSDDQALYKKYEIDYLKDISMVSTFGDIDEMGVEFDLEKDFEKQSKEAAE